jgi:hypothetical protein
MAVYDLYGKDLISTQEWSREELHFVIEFAKDIKRWKYAGYVPELFKEQDFLYAVLQHEHKNKGFF